MKVKGLLINVLSSSHKHFESIIREGLWGFPLDRANVNRKRFDRLELNMPVLLYFEHKGVKGIWAECRLSDRYINKEPVKYWVLNPIGYPLQIELEFIIPKEVLNDGLDAFDAVTPIKREELASGFNIPVFRSPSDRWSLYVFGDPNESGVTYPYNKFKSILDEFEARNKIMKRPTKLDHKTIQDLIYDIGQIQGKYPEKEYPIENKLIDVVWRRTAKSVPYMAFEIHISGNLHSDLIKLKHAYDLWNAIPVLITTEEKVDEARRWIEGSFHEVKNVFRILTIKDIQELYESKRKIKRLETKLGIF